MEIINRRENYRADGGKVVVYEHNQKKKKKEKGGQEKTRAVFLGNHCHNRKWRVWAKFLMTNSPLFLFIFFAVPPLERNNPSFSVEMSVPQSTLIPPFLHLLLRKKKKPSRWFRNDHDSSFFLFTQDKKGTWWRVKWNQGQHLFCSLPPRHGVTVKVMRKRIVQRRAEPLEHDLIISNAHQTTSLIEIGLLISENEPSRPFS